MIFGKHTNVTEIHYDGEEVEGGGRRLKEVPGKCEIGCCMFTSGAYRLQVRVDTSKARHLTH